MNNFYETGPQQWLLCCSWATAISQDLLKLCLCCRAVESEDATETEALLSAAEQGQAGVGKFFYFSTFVQAALIVHELHLLDLTSLRQVAFFWHILELLLFLFLFLLFLLLLLCAPTCKVMLKACGVWLGPKHCLCGVCLT